MAEQQTGLRAFVNNVLGNGRQELRGEDLIQDVLENFVSQLDDLEVGFAQVDEANADDEALIADLREQIDDRERVRQRGLTLATNLRRLLED